MSTRGVLTKKYILALQEQLLNIGYDNVELSYLSTDEKNATLTVTYGKTITTIGLFGIEGFGIEFWINGGVSSGQMTDTIRPTRTSQLSKNWGQPPSAEQLAKEIFSRDPAPRFELSTLFKDKHA